MANTSTAPPFKVKALFDYSSPHDDDLNFPADEVITVTEEEDDDWYYGEYTERSSGTLKQGIFPKNFVERIVVELPPRPTRSGGGRPKKPAEDHQEEYGGKSPPHQASPPASVDPLRGPTVNTAAAASSRPSTSSTIASPVAKEAPKQMEVRSPPRVVEEPRPAPVQQQQQERPTPASPPQAPKPAFNPKPAVPSGSEEKKPAGSKPPPPEKPSSFKDRLALFNKASAAPIAPYNPHKPPVNFIKKPFVAPPPSKNSYVPPPNQHVPKPKRDEDSNYIRPETTEDTSRRSAEQERDKEEERPKLALKDRIALLQTQQLDPTGVPGGKPKRPPKPKRSESEQTAGEGNTEETTHSGPTQEEARHERRSIDSSQGPDAEEHEPAPRPKKSMDIGRDEHGRAESSAGEADASSIAEEPSTIHRPRPTTATREDKSDDGDDEGANDDTPDVPSDDDDEEEVDPEVARKIAIRERIAKMSGGMGMHGMFGPPMGIPMGGPPPAPPKKKKSPPRPSREDEDQPRRSHDGTEEVEERPMSSSSQTQQQPVALPFALPRVQPPPVVERQQSDSEEEPARDTVGTGRKISDEQDSDDEVDVEDLKPQPPQSPPQHPLGPRPMPTSPKAERTLPERVVPMSPPILPQERPVPPPPPIPSERPAPPLPPTEQLLPAAVEVSPSDGSVSDDEMSAPPSKLSLTTSELDVQPRGAPPPPPGAPSIPSGRPQSGYGDTKSPTSPASKRVSQGYFSPMQASSPIGPPGSPPTAFNKRASYQRGAGGMPPVPGGIPLPSGAALQQPPNVARPPPPPPPPPSGPPRHSIDDARAGMSEASGSNRPSDTEEEVTEYEADYDTDIGNKVAHRDALKGKEHGKDEEDETPLPSPTISPQAPPRSVPPPPPPPGNPPLSRKGRQSVDMPRAAPPPAPPTQTQEQEQYGDDEYDPYKYDSPRYESPPPPAQPTMPPPPTHQAPPPQERQPSRGGTSRQSLDVSRPPQGSGRRSMDQSRPSAEYVARDIDLGESTQWWKSPNTPPPIFQNRPRELYFEVEESTSSRRGGRTTITKDVYILFHDYSQTVVTARYDRDEPHTASLEQRHEAPPPQPRQDQLEDFQSKFGAKIYAGARSREGTVVAGGDSEAFIRELLALAPGFLPPAGGRSYGALIYANLANASVQQFDEIRAGDIITFRNAKFQGHKGGLHQKYNMEVGKPDHVAVVVDWDGTKKKLRAWEQRESKKVKVESFKVGDLRSGEVKVWRVVGREWVGWGVQQ